MAPGNKDPKRGCRSGAAHDLITYLPAIIIYPSLLTPEILIGDEYFQLLILGKKDYPLSAHNVNWQLKISEGLDVQKQYREKPLFSQSADSYIKGTFDNPVDVSDTIYATNSKIKAILDKRAIKRFKKKGYTKLYGVNITNAFIRKPGVYNLFWVYTPWGPIKTESLNRLNGVKGGKCTPYELHDRLMGEVLEEMNGGNIVDKGRYCFRLDGSDVDITQTDLMNPIQSYHPVFYHEKLNYANIAHMGDVHITSRHQILGKSGARVIDYREKDAEGAVKEADMDVSPEIGPMVNSCSRNLAELLHKIGKDNSIHVVLISGDIIDYIKNIYIGYVKDFKAAKMRIKEIWEWVKLEGNYEDRYQDFVDYISLYALFVDFYSRYGKPIYLVSGNHDCYYKPYGISPRAYGMRANEGIPADHNLTIYEACLMFGKTYGKITGPVLKNLIGIGNFKKDKLMWMYTTLTPFSDFVVDLPKQRLIGLAWGDQEDIIDIFKQGQDRGHLPRSDDAVTDQQLKLIKSGLGDGKRIMLFSHFTFASYQEKFPMTTAELGDIPIGDWIIGRYSKHNMGTFETNRRPIFDDLMNKRKVHMTLSGHSHRRGLYGIDKWGSKSVQTSYSDFTGKNLSRVPLMMVSDSAGPMPRFNKWGEFGQWGSDKASASRITFKKDGSVGEIRAIRAGERPRFVVALDYMDIFEQSVITRFDSDYDDPDLEAIGWVKYKFTFWWQGVPKWLTDAVYVKQIRLYTGTKSGWKKIPLVYEQSENKWKIVGDKDSKLFRIYFARQQEGAVFVAIQFGNRREDLLGQYDFDSWWTFPIKIKHVPSPGMEDLKWKHYEISRDKKDAEIPSFGWRTKFAKYK